MSLAAPGRLVAVLRWSHFVLADEIDVHVSQLRRYEAGTSQRLSTSSAGSPSRSTSASMCSSSTRTSEPSPDDIAHHLEALNQLDPDEQAGIRALIEGALLRHQARKLAG